MRTVGTRAKRALAVGVGAFLAGAAGARAQQQPVYTATLEPETSSVWISGFEANGQAIAGEWRDDGTFWRVAGPFTPFTAHSAREQFQGNAAPVLLDGAFGVVGNYRVLYRRNADGSFTASELFSAPGRYACNETSSTPACLLFAQFVDGRNLPVVEVFNEKQQLSYEYYQNGAYRPSTGAEVLLGTENIVFSTNTIGWSPDGHTAVYIQAVATPGSTITYSQYGDSGRTDKALALPDGAVATTAFVMQRGDAIYVAAATQDTTGIGGVATYRVKDPFSAMPVLQPLLRVTSSAATVQLVQIDDTSLYYAKDERLYAQPLAGGAPVDLAACPKTSPMPLPATGANAGGTWVACGKALMRLNNGVVTTSRALASNVATGTPVKEDGANYDLVVQEANGTFLRIRSGRADQTTQLQPVAAPPTDLAPVWDEAAGPCGVGGGAVWCRRGDAWRAQDLGIGAPSSVVRAGDAWWAVSSDGAGKYHVYRRQGTQAWAELGAWPATTAPVLARTALGGVAVDLGGRTLWTLAGDRFSEGYAHDRALATVPPAIAADGSLYDFCPVAGTPNAVLCEVQPDGKSVPVVGGPAAAPAGPALFLPLKRGALMQTGGDVYVVRAGKAIEISHLYGELLPASSEKTYLNVYDGTDGSVVIEKQTTPPSGFPVKSAYYVYDGEDLTRQHLSPSRHRLPQASLVIVTTQPPQATTARQTWRDADGTWRATLPGYIEPLAHGATPVDALFGNESIEPDYVNDAAIAGSDYLLGTDDGLWTCPRANAASVTPATRELPLTPGCKRQAALPYVTQLSVFDGGYFAAQAKRVITLTELSAEAATTISEAEAAHARFDGTLAVWTEGQTLVRYDAATRGRLVLALPVDASDVVAVAKDWVCAGSGAYHWDGTAWQPEAAITRCSALTAHDDTATIATSDSLYACNTDGCSTALPLPQSFDPDGILGELSVGGGNVPALVLGGHVYALVTGVFNDITPTYASGSLVISAGSTLKAPGLLSTQGGGLVVVPPTPGTAWHVRVD